MTPALFSFMSRFLQAAKSFPLFFVIAANPALRRLPRIDGEVFLHASLTPLDDAVLDPSDVGQLDFDGECEGMCGV